MNTIPLSDGKDNCICDSISDQYCYLFLFTRPQESSLEANKFIEVQQGSFRIFNLSRAKTEHKKLLVFCKSYRTIICIIFYLVAKSNKRNIEVEVFFEILKVILKLQKERTCCYFAHIFVLDQKILKQIRIYYLIQQQRYFFSYSFCKAKFHKQRVYKNFEKLAYSNFIKFKNKNLRCTIMFVVKLQLF
ncbi:hypothetical protein TTHERM_001014502 (macronuclear) [Tetrahymena thermophila SB210]|uniref:Uncharacterized protein n=1 Tax=Tetrahymena thermophila (strain SB210) TaxID=312017 RepID=W7XHB6_TETTS|nr:hypothetical protein TTHERM_001014502 [Tetrahymena thermophila SB210]EWS72444.1 hypothetical protein TTHERM_001014502 [Tetrahymena thermophila SB210]|eukprot:XP_012655015.1 hypothetical protein TTHERM_001014502 [Tetrahymena thermophila SB210]